MQEVQWAREQKSKLSTFNWIYAFAMCPKDANRTRNRVPSWLMSQFPWLYHTHRLFSRFPPIQKGFLINQHKKFSLQTCNSADKQIAQKTVYTTHTWPIIPRS